MFDACEQSLQLPVFLAAQKSINTLFFRVEPLGKVSPIRQCVSCKKIKNKNQRLSVFPPVSRTGNRENNCDITDNISYYLSWSLQNNPRSAAFGFTLDKLCLLGVKLDFILTTSHVGGGLI